MPNNLIVSYDLNGKYETTADYARVFKAIIELGEASKPQKSVWYVKSKFGSKEAAEHVWKSMDRSDSLLVVDATNNTAHWFNIDKGSEASMLRLWPI